jgi:hypothetical protein
MNKIEITKDELEKYLGYEIHNVEVKYDDSGMISIYVHPKSKVEHINIKFTIGKSRDWD